MTTTSPPPPPAQVESQTAEGPAPSRPASVSTRWLGESPAPQPGAEIDPVERWFRDNAAGDRKRSGSGKPNESSPLLP